MTTYVYLAGRTTTDGGCHDCHPESVYNSQWAAMEYVDVRTGNVYPTWIASMRQEDTWIKLDAGYNAAHVKQGWWEGWYVRKMELRT